ncbi:MAG: phosphoenolpyruvate--protein phosphotransferase [Deltaproteobacteria bacterium]|nr:phosphoenolpyruvate--protein phosphotransferase [Deltaproteobacteria bacterium]
MRKAKTKNKHLSMLCDIGDLTNLLAGSYTIDNFLLQAAKMVARYLDAQACSIYLYDESTDELVLTATSGLNPRAVGKVRIKMGEGIVGHCLKQLTPVCEGEAIHNPHFKYFEEAKEDRFHSFLVVPIHRGPVKIGALVVEHERPDYFDESDTIALRAATSQLASSIENARMLMEIHLEDDRLQSSRTSEIPHLIKATAAVEGFAFAPAKVYRKNPETLLHDASLHENRYTMADFQLAVESTAQQLQNLQSRFAKRLPESASLIFTTHFMMLKDPSFVGEMTRIIQQGTPVSLAVSQVSLHYISLFSSNTHGYIREKANDVEDLALRILRNLTSPGYKDDNFSQRSIVIASQLYPSDILKLVSDDVQGIILAGGGITAHISILSRSLQIPLVLADQQELLSLPDNTPVLIDAHIGNIYIDPSDDIVRQFEERRSVSETARLTDDLMQPITQTRDRVRVHLMANINLLSEIVLARQLKAEGVGLYRTEFPFLIRSTFPSETEQYLVYKRLVDEMKDLPVTIRTLDVGGEKVLSYLDAAQEPNPELGLRSIRFTLRHRDIFETQIRAILRAAEGSPGVRIMFPMISSLDQFIEAKQVVFDCMESLKKEKLPYHPNPEIGMMVELPSVLEIMDALAETADFFSIGTNGFIQYMLGVDRTNQKVSDYYCPHHPSVLRGISKVVDAVQLKGKEVSVCGEMAHEPAYIPFFLGIGIRLLSIDPLFLPEVQQCITGMNISDAETYAASLLAQSTLKGIEALMAEHKQHKLINISAEQ